MLGLLVLVAASLIRSNSWPIFIAVGIALCAAGWSKRPKLKTCFVNGVVLLLSTLVAFAAAESAVRLFEIGRETPSAMIYRHHPVRRYEHIPGIYELGTYRGDGGAVQTYGITISSQGLRDREYPPKTPDEYRILMIGDSYTFGTGLEQEETVPKCLERQLRRRVPGKAISVINGGVSGFSPWQELHLLVEYVAALQPDLVVLQLLPENDIAGSLSHEGRLLRCYNELGGVYDVMWSRYNNDWKVRMDFALRWRSDLYSVIFVRSRGRLGVTRFLNGLRPFHSPDFPALEKSEDRDSALEVSLEEWYPELTQAWEKYTEDVRNIRAECESRGVKLIAYVAPDIGVLLKSVQSAATIRLGDSMAYEFGKGQRLSEEFLAAEEIPFVPITKSFRGHAAPDALYLLWDGHFSPVGAEFVALQLADALESDIAIAQPAGS